VESSTPGVGGTGPTGGSHTQGEEVVMTEAVIALTIALLLAIVVIDRLAR
jgi:hypothetical protein